MGGEATRPACWAGPAAYHPPGSPAPWPFGQDHPLPPPYGDDVCREQKSAAEPPNHRSSSALIYPLEANPNPNPLPPCRRLSFLPPLRFPSSLHFFLFSEPQPTGENAVRVWTPSPPSPSSRRSGCGNGIPTHPPSSARKHGAGAALGRRCASASSPANSSAELRIPVDSPSSPASFPASTKDLVSRRFPLLSPLCSAASSRDAIVDFFRRRDLPDPSLY